MNTITHGLAPAALYAGIQLLRRKPINWVAVAWITGAGAAADLLDPHLKLEARFTSWSHSLLGMGVVMSIAAVAIFLKIGIRWSVWFWMCFGYALHLFCDGIAGGICPFRPFNGEIIGEYYVMPSTWFYYDGGLILLMFILFDINRKHFANKLVDVELSPAKPEVGE